MLIVELRGCTYSKECKGCGSALFFARCVDIKRWASRFAHKKPQLLSQCGFLWLASGYSRFACRLIPAQPLRVCLVRASRAATIPLANAPSARPDVLRNGSLKANRSFFVLCRDAIYRVSCHENPNKKFILHSSFFILYASISAIISTVRTDTVQSRISKSITASL
jgi:hypothetical protein